MVALTKAPADGEPAGARWKASERPSNPILAPADQAAQASSLILLDEEELFAVIKALLSTNGPSTEDQIVKVASWANRIRAEASVLELVLAGRVGIRLDEDDELIFVAKESGP